MKNGRFTHGVAIFFALVLFVSVLTGCAAAAPAAPATKATASEAAPQAPMADYAAAPSAAPAAVEMPASAENGSSGVSTGSANSSANIPTDQRKIIRNANLTIETKNFTADVASVEQRVNAIGGYLQNSYVTGRQPKQWGDSPRSASITARIPAEKLDTFLNDVRGIGEVIQENTGSDDVTMQYFDTESHVKVLKIQLERLQSILAQSDKLADVLALETEIARIQYEIEQLTTDLRRWDNLVSYCTVSINLNEVTQFSTPTVDNGKLGDRIRNAFNKSVTGTVNFLEGLLVVLVAIVPALPILLVIAAIIFFIVRASRKARRKREAEAAAKRAAGSGGNDSPDKPDKAFR